MFPKSFIIEVRLDFKYTLSIEMFLQFYIYNWIAFAFTILDLNKFQMKRKKKLGKFNRWFHVMSKTCFEDLLGDNRWMSWERPKSTSRQRILDVSLKRPLDVNSERPQDLRSERLQDGQIRLFCDVLETL